MTTIEIPAPPSLGALLVLSTEQHLTVLQAEALRAQGESVAARIHAARDSGEWPVVVVCDMALTVEWIPAPVRVRMDDDCPCGPGNHEAERDKEIDRLGGMVTELREENSRLRA